MPDAILTKRLILRPFVDSDGDAVVAALGNLNVTRWLAQVPHPFTAADLKLHNPDGSSRWPELAAVTRDGVLIGAVIYTDDLGYWIAPEFWGQGFATEAASAMIELVFDQSEADEICTGYLDGNRASARVLDKLGFRETGEERTRVKSLGTEMRQINMVLSRDDWSLAA